MNTIRTQAGTSLLEVLVALAITGVITAATLRLYIVQHQNYLTQDDITEIQQSARASIDELTRHIRMAGNGLPHGLPPIIAADTDPDTITVTYRTDNCETYLSVAMTAPSAELKCATDVSCFQDGQWVYIFHPDSGGGEWFVTSDVEVGAKEIRHITMALSQAYDKDAILMSMQQVRFFVDHTSDTAHPNLMVQLPGQAPQVYAENIADLQLRYRLKNGLVVDEPLLAEDVREVLISVTGRSKHPDDEDPNGDYRFRTYFSSVNVRNLHS